MNDEGMGPKSQTKARSKLRNYGNKIGNLNPKQAAHGYHPGEVKISRHVSCQQNALW